MTKFLKFKTVILGCFLTLFTGCGAVPPNDETDTVKDENRAITIAEAKTAVLDNAGLSEQDVRFVRFYLDSTDGDSKYDIEFISGNAEYDYVVHAVTGNILSMHCETGDYNINNIPPEIMPSTNASPSGELTPTAFPFSPAPSAAPPSSATAPPEIEQQYIGVEAAKQAALLHAGLTAADVRFAHAHLEFEHGRWSYDVEFHKDNTSYDYDIDALTGEALSFEHDTEYRSHGNTVQTGSRQITREEAVQIALKYAGVSEADAQYLKVELDYDDGRTEYEVEWDVGQYEYTCDIDAYTGEIISFEKELD